MDIEKIIEEYNKMLIENTIAIENQLKKGCGNCSQWDDEFGCFKCNFIVND